MAADETPSASHQPEKPEDQEINKTESGIEDRNDSSHSEQSWRVQIGRRMGDVSDLVNDNLVAARYGTFAAIALVTAYGLSNTPLFFRFKTVQDIPVNYFLRRRSIPCRLIHVETRPQGDGAAPVVVWVRHMSPIGRFLDRSAFDFLMKASPAAAIGKKLESSTEEMLQVEIAGVEEPPSYVNDFDQPGSWLRRLAEERTRIKCELLHRQSWVDDEAEKVPNQSAVCRLYYTPGGEFFRKDLGAALVRYGRASVLSSGSMFVEKNQRSNHHLQSSRELKHLQSDSKYMDALQKLEYEAIKESRGMWADSSVRATKKDLVEEVEYQTNATIFQKLWNWYRGR